MPYHKTKILIIDDERSLLMTAGQLLQIAGYDVLTASSGEEGLTIARKEPVRMILLDVMMPGMSGFDVLRELHKDPMTTAIPVVMLTALRSSADERTSRLAGAREIMIKPVERKELVDTVKRYAGGTLELDQA